MYTIELSWVLTMSPLQAQVFLTLVDVIVDWSDPQVRGLKGGRRFRAGYGNNQGLPGLLPITCVHFIVN